MNNNWKYYIGIVLLLCCLYWQIRFISSIRQNRQLSCNSASRCGWSRNRG